jgi:hypothetical protein
MSITYLRRIRQSLWSTRSLQTQRLGELIVPRLQVEPVALGHPEVMREVVGDVGVDRSLSLDDLVDTPRGNTDVFGQMPDAYSFRS